MPQAPLATRRADLLTRLDEDCHYDVAVVGGGATGLGVALDAAARGLKVVLLEAHDFAKGTSSRSTKLVHGGVRYLAQGNLKLVHEALHERALLLHNAPHLAQPLAFVMPTYRWWEKPFYGAGLKAYDALAGRAGLGSTQLLDANQTQKVLPTVQMQGLLGGVKYWDGQFDDARLALALARSAARLGALLINYCAVTDLRYDGSRIAGLACKDVETGRSFAVTSKCVINATGVWVDALREKDGAATRLLGGAPVRPMVAPSQGLHLVVDRDFLASDAAMMVPKTRDGRVLFAVPWLGKVILGTTDTPSHELATEPRAYAHELDFILQESARYLARAPMPQDIKSLWVGLRPLVKPPEKEEGATQALSREHTVRVSRTGLVTVTGGKWTTYRAMAEDVLEACFDKQLMKRLPAGVTANFKLVGAATSPAAVSLAEPAGLHSYGDEALFVEDLPGADEALMSGLTAGMVRFAARFEYARTVEDVLARRSRLLFLDAKHAAKLAPRVAELLREEDIGEPQLAAFLRLAVQYAEKPARLA
jgi:glycerol-3-phosphate dehydrogenase